MMDRRKMFIGVVVVLLAAAVVAGIAIPRGGSSGDARAVTGNATAKGTGPATGRPEMYVFSTDS
jgi:hypothetical protein